MLLIKYNKTGVGGSVLLAIMLVFSQESQISAVSKWWGKSFSKLKCSKIYNSHNSSSLDYTIVTNKSSSISLDYSLQRFTAYKGGVGTEKIFRNSLSAYLAPAQTSNGFGTLGKNK